MTWTATISGEGFSKNTDGTSITAAANSGNKRTGSVSYTQGTSGKTASVSLSQSSPMYVLTITNLVEETTYYLFKGNSNPVGTGTSYLGFLGGPTAGDFTENWGPSTPLRVNDPTKSSGMTTTATTGDLITIKKRSGSRWVQVGSVTLANQNQTVRVTG